MVATLRALLREIIDYAGLFPPAQLALEPAIRNFAQYAGGADAWMLGRFVCPAARLRELAPLARSLLSTERVLRVSALGRGGDDAAAFLANLREDLAEVASFDDALSGFARVDAFEARLPAGLLRDECSGELVRMFIAARAAFGAADLAHVPMACEAPLSYTASPPISSGAERRFSAEARQMLRAAVGAIAFHNTKFTIEQSGTTADLVAFKLRCGGKDAAAFPSPAQAAEALAMCIDSGVALKFTAGLHHPMPRRDAGVPADMLGFLPLFAAAALGRAHALDAAALEPIIAQTDAAAFQFGESELCVGEWAVGVQDIEDARRETALAVGSCSFDEPREDLRSLGWFT